MKHYHIVMICIGAFLVPTLNSCIDLPVSNIDIDVPAVESKLGLHAFLIDLDSTITIHLDKSRSYFEKETLDNGWYGDLPNANIRLYSENKLIATLKHIPEEIRSSIEVNTLMNYTDTLTQILGAYGQNFTLRVTHPDYDAITATQTFPNFVPITSANLIRNVGTDFWDGSPTDGIEVTIIDPVNESNYYQVSFQGYPGVSPYSKYESILFLSNEPALTTRFQNKSGTHWAYLSDETFDGASFRFSVSFTSQTAQFDTIYVRWRTITKEWYEYIRSSKEQSELNEFLGNYAEPFNVISNIEGGHGVFGLGRERLFVVSE